MEGCLNKPLFSTLQAPRTLQKTRTLLCHSTPGSNPWPHTAPLSILSCQHRRASVVGHLTEGMPDLTGPGKRWPSAYQRIAHLICDALVCSLEIEDHMILTCLPQPVLPLPTIRP